MKQAAVTCSQNRASPPRPSDIRAGFAAPWCVTLRKPDKPKDPGVDFRNRPGPVPLHGRTARACAKIYVEKETRKSTNKTSKEITRIPRGVHINGEERRCWHRPRR